MIKLQTTLLFEAEKTMGFNFIKKKTTFQSCVATKAHKVNITTLGDHL